MKKSVLLLIALTVGGNSFAANAAPSFACLIQEQAAKMRLVHSEQDCSALSLEQMIQEEVVFNSKSSNDRFLWDTYVNIPVSRFTTTDREKILGYLRPSAGVRLNEKERTAFSSLLVNIATRDNLALPNFLFCNKLPVVEESLDLPGFVKVAAAILRTKSVNVGYLMERYTSLYGENREWVSIVQSLDQALPKK